MTVPEPLLDATAIRELLTELGARLAAKDVEARMFVVGGAAMALAFSRSRVTRDIDAVFEPKAVIYSEAEAMAGRHGLPSGWLNDGVKGFMPERVQPVEGTVRLSLPGLSVGVASAEYLFAMKAAAARQETDGDDLRVLARLVGVTTAEEGLELVEEFYGPGRLTVKTQLLLEDVLASMGGAADSSG